MTKVEKNKWSGGKCPYCKQEHLHISPFCEKYPTYKSMEKKYKWSKPND